MPVSMSVIFYAFPVLIRNLYILLLAFLASLPVFVS